ncbi:MAG: hypothetical protein ISN29_02610 [Gammaproteobacteria bacterium AqS3]|nr:hypothetical protein [Gammaproteobacteria bacterium AqS3]
MADSCMEAKERPRPFIASCSRCSVEFEYYDALKRLFDAKVKVLEHGVYCVDCMTYLSEEENKQRLAEAEQDMTAVLERMKEGKTHDGHEKMIENVVEALHDKSCRIQEYTYDTSVLCLSIVLLAETEMKRLTMRLNKIAEDEDKDYAVLVGRYEGLKERLTGWLSDANDLFSDFSVYATNHCTIHRMDEQEN